MSKFECAEFLEARKMYKKNYRKENTSRENKIMFSALSQPDLNIKFIWRESSSNSLTICLKKVACSTPSCLTFFRMTPCRMADIRLLLASSAGGAVLWVGAFRSWSCPLCSEASTSSIVPGENSSRTELMAPQMTFKFSLQNRLLKRQGTGDRGQGTGGERLVWS